MTGPVAFQDPKKGSTPLTTQHRSGNTDRRLGLRGVFPPIVIRAPSNVETPSSLKNWSFPILGVRISGSSCLLNLQGWQLPQQPLRLAQK